MSKYSIDFNKLDHKLNHKVYKLSEVQDQIEKVAFDIVKFKDNDKSADLWKIEKDSDGEYIVALYKTEDTEKVSWDVTLDKVAHALEISYKGDPLVKVAGAKLGIPQKDLFKATQYLPVKLAENKKLVKGLLSLLSESAKKTVLSKYPELGEF